MVDPCWFNFFVGSSLAAFVWGAGNGHPIGILATTFHAEQGILCIQNVRKIYVSPSMLLVILDRERAFLTELLR